jgi:hypothetical protein
MKDSKATPPTTAKTALPDNKGEGDYKAARNFNESETRFVADHKVEDAARAAAPVSPAEAGELLDAERKGLQHAKGEDPQVKRP